MDWSCGSSVKPQVQTSVPQPPHPPLPVKKESLLAPRNYLAHLDRADGHRLPRVGVSSPCYLFERGNFHFLSAQMLYLPKIQVKNKQAKTKFFKYQSLLKSQQFKAYVLES
jgi:hypothetical protein